jgi:hypothetical protein
MSNAVSPGSAAVIANVLMPFSLGTTYFLSLLSFASFGFRIDSICFAAPVFFHLTRYFFEP